jgi:hypothetical protein
MFPSTQPPDADPLMRLSEYQRQFQLSTHGEDSSAGITRLSALNPSLMQDLMRYDRQPRTGEGLDVLEVLAAALRHNRALLLHLQIERRAFALTVRPQERLVWSPLTQSQLFELRFSELRVLRVEPALAIPAPDSPQAAAFQVSPLGTLLWELSLRGGRDKLLPEINGVASYRVAPGADLKELDLTGTLAAAVVRLRKETTPLRTIASWPGFDADRAVRMLNGLYLQAALMVSRTHPGAITPE